MPDENQPSASAPQDGSSYSPSQTYPRDIGPDGLPVREGKPQARQEAPRTVEDEDTRAANDVNLGRS